MQDRTQVSANSITNTSDLRRHNLGICQKITSAYMNG